ncbi:MAG: DUF5399 family protein [Chlamydiia bacterium]
MVRTVSDLGSNVVQQYTAGQQALDEHAAIFRDSSRVSQAASVDRIVPMQEATVQQLGLHQQRKPWASFGPPDGYSLGGRGIFGTYLSTSLGATSQLEDRVSRIEGITPAKKATPQATKPTEAMKAIVMQGMQRLVDASSMHEDVKIQTVEFIQG